MKKISIVISTYNDPKYLKLVLDSVISQQGIAVSEFEIIIADDGSTVETEKLITDYKQKSIFNIKHVWHEDLDFRKSMILNKAVAESTGEYLVFIDGDCVIPVNFIATQLKLRENGWFIAGNRVLLSEKFTKSILYSQDIGFKDWSSINWLIAKLTGKTNKLLHWVLLATDATWRKKRANNWKYPKGCNIAVARSDYIAVNGYDESFIGWGHEDSDFFVRLLHSGIKIKDGRFAVPVYHLWHKTNDRSRASLNWDKFNNHLNDIDCVQITDGIDKYL